MMSIVIMGVWINWINQVSELENEADTWHTNAIQKNSKEEAQTTELQSRILGKEDVRQLIFISFTIVHNKNRFKVEKIADLLDWLRNNPVCSNKSPGFFANQETLMHLCNAISAEAGTQLSRRKVTGTQAWNTLERISKTDKNGNKNIMPQYRMLDPVKIKTHINLLKFEYRNISKEKAQDNEYIKRFYIEAGSSLDKPGNICMSFGALMSFFQKTT
ncbi:hypothetical protein MNBD_GAMMA11-1445 [hydrothermal vent metagenome]|uniref:Uncharacterized protein n=1 Tax=hydrothermal vent metagenome TaxID=652676 RepID=A0A3B0XP79_9ZZZZ